MRFHLRTKQNNQNCSYIKIIIRKYFFYAMQSEYFGRWYYFGNYESSSAKRRKKDPLSTDQSSQIFILSREKIILIMFDYKAEPDDLNNVCSLFLRLIPEGIEINIF
jgi:hypothetical protein